MRPSPSRPSSTAALSARPSPPAGVRTEERVVAASISVAAPPVAAPLAIPPTRPAVDWERWRIVPGSDRGDGWSQVACPRCESHASGDPFATALAHLGRGTFFCASCGLHGDATVAPNQYRIARIPLTDPWWQLLADEELAQWLHRTPEELPLGLEIGLDQALVLHDDGKMGWETALVFPCRGTAEGPVVSLQFLPIDDDGQWLAPTDLPNTDAVPWGWDRIDGQTAVFVDHPLDKIALMAAGVANVVCLPARMNPLLPGGGDWSILAHIEKSLQSMGRLVMALREDEAGQALGEELARRMGKDRCFRVRWQELRAEDGSTGGHSALAHYGREAVFQAVEKAPAFPVAGVHELYDVEESLETLYEFGLQPGVSTGWPSLDEFYTVKTSQWTAVTGIPSHGKSTFVDALSVNLAQMHGWRFGVFSPENQPVERYYASLMEKASGLPFSQGPRARLSVEKKNQLKGWIHEHFKAILPDEDTDGNWTVDSILSLGRTLVYRHGIKGLIIDPWNELTHIRPPHMTLAEYISQELTKIRRFARTYGVHVWVVVHPIKQEKASDGKYAVVTPYALDGGANWRNKADNILSGFRNVGDIDEDVFDVYAQKIRFKEVGRVGRASLRGDPICGRYIDDIDQARRAHALAQPQPVASSQLRTAERKARLGPGLPIHETSSPIPTAYVP